MHPSGAALLSSCLGRTHHTTDCIHGEIVNDRRFSNCPEVPPPTTGVQTASRPKAPPEPRELDRGRGRQMSTKEAIAQSYADATLEERPESAVKDFQELAKTEETVYKFLKALPYQNPMIPFGPIGQSHELPGLWKDSP